MRIDILSIFPDYLAPLSLSLIGKAQAKGLLEVQVHDLRRWATDVHRTVDDTPYGGGAGMVMLPEIWGRALDELLPAPSGGYPNGAPAPSEPAASEPHLIFTTPSGTPFTQRIAEDLANNSNLIFCCGRYEGIDARVPQYYRNAGYQVSEISIGDYVLNGGEVAALVMVEAITRLIPGVIGNPDSLAEESHNDDGLLEYPSYTKPPIWRGLAVPEILLSGNHARIGQWRHQAALSRTEQFRPELLPTRIEE